MNSNIEKPSYHNKKTSETAEDINNENDIMENLCDKIREKYGSGNDNGNSNGIIIRGDSKSKAENFEAAMYLLCPGTFCKDQLMQSQVNLYCGFKVLLKFLDSLKFLVLNLGLLEITYN